MHSGLECWLPEARAGLAKELSTRCACREGSLTLNQAAWMLCCVQAGQVNQAQLHGQVPSHGWWLCLVCVSCRSCSSKAGQCPFLSNSCLHPEQIHKLKSHHLEPGLLLK